MTVSDSDPTASPEPEGSGSGDGNGGGTRLLDQCFETFVYAPLGFALDAPQLYPKLAERGRNELNLATMVGRFAVKKGSSVAEQYLERGAEQVSGLLRDIGLLPKDEAPAPPRSSGATIADLGIDVPDASVDHVEAPSPSASFL